MVILNAIGGERVYLDTNVFIYAIEGYPEFVDELNEFIDSIDAGNLKAFTSELTLAEVLVRPLMDGNLEIQIAYQQALQSSQGLEVVPVSREPVLPGVEVVLLSEVIEG